MTNDDIQNLQPGNRVKYTSSDGNEAIGTIWTFKALQVFLRAHQEDDDISFEDEDNLVVDEAHESELWVLLDDDVGYVTVSLMQRSAAILEGCSFDRIS